LYVSQLLTTNPRFNQVWEVRDYRKTGLERSSVQTLGQEGEYPVAVHLRTLEGGPVQVLAGYDALWEQVAQKEIKVWERAPRSLTQNLWSWSEAHYMADVTAVSLAAEPGKVLTISEDGAVLTVWDATSLAPLYTKVRALGGYSVVDKGRLSVAFLSKVASSRGRFSLFIQFEFREPCLNAPKSVEARGNSRFTSL
jgi:hypothetical protein